MPVTSNVDRHTTTPCNQSLQESRSESRSFEVVEEPSVRNPIQIPAPPAARDWCPVDASAQPVPLRERACRSLKSTAVFASALLGGGLAGWASYAVTVQAGGSVHTALAVGAVLGSVTSSCLRAGIDFWREHRQLHRVAPAPAGLAPDQLA